MTQLNPEWLRASKTTSGSFTAWGDPGRTLEDEANFALDEAANALEDAYREIERLKKQMAQYAEIDAITKKLSAAKA